MPLEHLSWGLVLSHLAGCYRELADALRQPQPELGPPLRRLRTDPVYRFLGGFRPPVPDAPGLIHLREQLTTVEQATQARCEELRRGGPDTLAAGLSAAIHPFLAHARAFVDSYSPRWDASSYFIVPVYVTADDVEAAGLTYLRRFDPAGGPASGWNLVGLTQDPGLLQLNRNYFEQVANVVMGVLYSTDWQRPHADPFRLRSDHVYKLAFNCEITAGRSHGGALLALFTLAFLNSTLGANYLNYVRPAPGTVISAVVEADGRIAAVSHAAEKVAAAIKEYGTSIRIILPAENRTDQLVALSHKMPKGHLRFVATAQELITAALFPDATAEELDESHPDPRRYILGEVRSLLLQQLSAPAREGLYAHLRPEVSPHTIHALLEEGPPVEYTTHPDGVLTRLEYHNSTLCVRVGFEESTFTPEKVAQPQLVILAVDGSAEMDHAWTPGEGGTCLVTEIILAAAKRLHERPGDARRDLAIAFLSTDQIQPVEPGTRDADLEASLQAFRASAHLRFRGAFVRPVAEQAARRFRQRAKRLCVLSDSVGYDFDDVEPSAFSSRIWFTVRGPASEDRVCLCPNDVLDESALDAHFATPRDALRSVVLLLGAHTAASWQPVNGKLTGSAGQQELTFPISADATSFVALVRLADAPRLSTFALRGEMIRHGAPSRFRFSDFVMAGRGPALPADTPAPGR